jgi:WD40 repeat protein
VRAFSENGTVLATTLGMWTIADALKPLHDWGVETWDVVLARDGSHSAIWTTRSGLRQIEVWSWAKERTTEVLQLDKPNGSLLAVSPDGRFVIIREDIEGETQVYDVVAPSIVARMTRSARAAAVSPSGECRVASRDDAVNVWTLGREGGAALAIEHEKSVVAVGLTSVGVVTTITKEDGRLSIRAREIRTGRQIPERDAQVFGTDAAFAPDGRTFAVMSDAGLEVRWADAPELVSTFAYPNPTAVAWSSDGRYLAAQHEREVRVWDLSDRRSLGQIALPKRPTALALGAGGHFLAAVISSGQETRRGEVHAVKVWNVSTAAELKSFEPVAERAPSTENTYCVLSPDARYVATGHLAAIHTTSGAASVKLEGDPNAISFCLISADGQYLVTSSPDSLRLWELKSGKEAYRIPTGDRLMVLDQESRYLATLVGDNTVRVWFLRPADLIEQACQRLPQNLSEAEWREYVGDETYRKACPQRP